VKKERGADRSKIMTDWGWAEVIGVHPQPTHGKHQYQALMNVTFIPRVLILFQTEI